jgi:hypothetical protein
MAAHQQNTSKKSGWRLKDKHLMSNKAKNISYYQHVQTRCGTHQAAYLMGNEASFPWDKTAKEQMRPLTSI